MKMGTSGSPRRKPLATLSRIVPNGKRKSPRRKVKVPGEISLGDRLSRLTCMIVDMSATGARLRLGGHNRTAGDQIQRLRQRIGLFFDQPCMSVECNVIWQIDDEIGVQFCTAFQRSQRAP